MHPLATSWAVRDTLLGVVMPCVIIIVATAIVAPRICDEENAHTAIAMSVMVSGFLLLMRLIGAIASILL